MHSEAGGELRRNGGRLDVWHSCSYISPFIHERFHENFEVANLFGTFICKPVRCSWFILSAEIQK
jgi:hypothetical protein